MVSTGPSSASGGITTLTREPSGRRASHQRAGLVHAPPQRREDPLDRVAQVGLVPNATAARSTRPRRSTHTGARPVDHHLVDRRVAQQRLQRAEPERALGHQRDQPRRARRRPAGRLALHQRARCARAGRPLALAVRPRAAAARAASRPAPPARPRLARHADRRRPRREVRSLSRSGCCRTPHGARTPRHAARRRPDRRGFALPASAPAATTWLCRPGHSPDPCAGSLNATLAQPRRQGRQGREDQGRHPGPDRLLLRLPHGLRPAGDQREPAHRSRADRDREVPGIALLRRVPGLGADVPPGHAEGDFDRDEITAKRGPSPTTSARSAWRDYVAHHNRGRGFVLIGHSQGTFVLRQLIKEEIDRKPALRRRLVSALLLGGNVTVRKGKRTGGDFRHVPACRSADRELGCVVAYSTFGDHAARRQPVRPGDRRRRLPPAGAVHQPGDAGRRLGQASHLHPHGAVPGDAGAGVALEIGPLPRSPRAG